MTCRWGLGSESWERKAIRKTSREIKSSVPSFGGFPVRSKGKINRILILQSLSSVRPFATPWTAACQASLSFTISWSLLKFMSVELVVLFNHLILCHPFLLLPSILPASGSFRMSQLFASGGQSIRVSASASVLPTNTQDWSPLEWTGWIPLKIINHYIVHL